MFSDVVEETLTLRMGDLQLQLPRTLPALSPSPPPLFSLKPELDLQDHGFDFYSSPFDNSFPYRGILNNERTFSSSPTSNTSFLSETSFTQILKSSQDSGNFSSDNFGLLTTSTPYRGGIIENGSDFQRALSGNDFGGSFLPQGNIVNDSLASSIGTSNQRWDSPRVSSAAFDFTFPAASESSSGISNWSGSIDSPSRLMNGAVTNLANQWNSSDVASLLDNQSPTESSSSSSVITTSALGNSIWSPSQVSAFSSNNGNGQQQWDGSLLAGLTRKQLFAFSELLKDKHNESLRDGDMQRAAQLQAALVQVQNQLIAFYVSDPESQVNTPTNTMPTPLPLLPSPTDHSLERVALMHREIAGSKDAPFTWSGNLPPRNHRNPVYSSKVFLGGLPWDICEHTLMHAFKPFGIVRIEWPGKKGYAYALFENEKQIKVLLQNCVHDYSSNKFGNYFFKITSKKFRSKDVQIIPWALTDSNFNRCQASKIDSQRTIFVGALHGMVNAEGLASIMNDLFGGVIYAGIDTCRLKYPIGSARVTFSNMNSYMKAVNAAFVVIKTARFEKKLQVDPYLEDATCSVCKLQQGPYFCRDSACFRYYCRTCFQHKHADEVFRNHRPLTRTTNNKQQGASPVLPASHIFSPNFQQQQPQPYSGGSGSNGRQYERNPHSNNNGFHGGQRFGNNQFGGNFGQNGAGNPHHFQQPQHVQYRNYPQQPGHQHQQYRQQHYTRW